MLQLHHLICEGEPIYGELDWEIRGLVNRLKSIDIAVSDEDMIVVLTAGLPTSYTPIIISFNTLESLKLTIDFVILVYSMKKVVKPLLHFL
jgi:hypothetical protein